VLLVARWKVYPLLNQVEIVCSSPLEQNLFVLSKFEWCSLNFLSIIFNMALETFNSFSKIVSLFDVIPYFYNLSLADMLSF